MNDLISRQAAIDAFMTATCDGDKAEWCTWVIKHVPSAQPDFATNLQPTCNQLATNGKWIIVTDSRGRHAECPYCGEWKYHQQQKFCGECGARMEGDNGQ